jgi:hypothetical protein
MMIWSSPILQEVHPFLSASLNLHSQVYTSFLGGVIRRFKSGLDPGYLEGEYVASLNQSGLLDLVQHVANVPEDQP